MNVEILNRDDIRESVPIELIINGVAEKPKIIVSNLGAVTPVEYLEGYKATFWSMAEGSYKIDIVAGSSSWSEIIEVQEQSYINFKQEFGLFSLLFVLVSLGVVKWIKHLKKVIIEEENKT
jgi:hypothetical protein